ncbi:MAG: GGDEF domain-containing protein [Gammaproteobacteria bacterium]|nr:GGDEF domain-containing protein [Gammaproteobacteria bacterium]
MKTNDIESRIDPENIQSRIGLLNSLLHKKISVQAFPILLEEEFQASYNENNQLRARITLFLGLIFFAASSVFDLAFFPNDFTSLTVRLFITTPLLLILASMSFTKYFYYFHQYYVLVFSFIIMVSLVIIAAIIPLYMKDLLYQSLTFTLLFITTLPRLQFRIILYASIMVLLIFNIGYLFSGINPPLHYYWSLSGNNYILSAAACLCLIASYFNESNARKQFILSNLVKMENALLAHLSHYDKLTNVANRRYFEEVLEKEWRRAMRAHHSLSLLFIDFDYFKQYNDLYGHQAGDRALSEIANVFIKCVRRAGDFVARFGGDEFIIIIPDDSLDNAVMLAKTIMLELKKLALENADSKISPLVTITIGITAIIPTVDMSTNVLIKQADLALQQR